MYMSVIAGGVEFGSGEDFQARRLQRESKGLQTSGVSTTSILVL
jgi:hypothetical protein